MSPVPPLRSALSALPRLSRFNLALLALAVLALSAWLWTEWKQNPDLSHGFFMPALFLLLLHESRQGTPRYLTPSFATRAGFGLLLAGGLCTLTLAGLYAAAIDWTYALIDVMLGISLTCILGAGLLAYSSETKRLVPFNWSAVVAVGLWLLVVPIPPGTYSSLTLNLQQFVSEGVLRSLHVLGIAAVRHGNVIDLANATVGVEEACSGVRSLISCVFAGLFFSATLVRRFWPRVAIIALSAPLALAMNFLRSLALTLMANAGIDIAGTWHDATGFAVLAITAGILGGLALLLERPTPATATPEHEAIPASANTTAPALLRHGVDRALAAVLGCAFALVAFFALNTRPAPTEVAPAPDLLSLLPASAEGWRVKTSDLYEFSGTLQTEHLAQRHYVRHGPDPLEIIIYVAYWKAGQAPVSLVASHTPDACWPGSGWVSIANPQPQVDLTAGSHALPRAEHRIFQGTGRPQHVWFWHIYDRRPIPLIDPFSPTTPLRLALRYGFRRAGDQMFVRISSNRPWSEIAQEPILNEFLQRTQTFGL